MSNNESTSDENKLDFEVLMRQLSTPSPFTSSSSASSSVPSEDEVWPLQLNTLFVDHYIFGDTIGKGSYAEVRECIDTRNLERCAVKIVNKHYLRRQAPGALANQKQEIRLLRRLKHPNLIAMKECLLKGPKIYIILEHCTFVLHDLLAEQVEKRLNAPIARSLFHQLMLGLEYLHSVGCVHRDIKPQNLLITNCGVLKIIDFGVSQLLSMWSTSDICSNYEGSPLFQAPEVVSGQIDYAGFKVDVWSAGVTLYLMIYGNYPFYDDVLLGLYDKILSEELNIPKSPVLVCGAAVADLLAFMLEKAHLKRATVQQILEHPWIRFQFAPEHHGENHCANEIHSEFIELTTTTQAANPDLQQDRQRQRDVYRSMTALPYLHNYHFPHVSVIKAKRQLSPGASTPAVSPSPSIGTSPSNSRNVSPKSIGSTALVDPHEMIDDKTIEWGNEEQYNLLKLPLIRANRMTYKLRQKREKGFRRRRVNRRT